MKGTITLEFKDNIFLKTSLGSSLRGLTISGERPTRVHVRFTLDETTTEKEVKELIEYITEHLLPTTHKRETK